MVKKDLEVALTDALKNIEEQKRKAQHAREHEEEVSRNLQQQLLDATEKVHLTRRKHGIILFFSAQSGFSSASKLS